MIRGDEIYLHLSSDRVLSIYPFWLDDVVHVALRQLRVEPDGALLPTTQGITVPGRHIGSLIQTLERVAQDIQP